jgi:hypothetical protein
LGIEAKASPTETHVDDCRGRSPFPLAVELGIVPATAQAIMKKAVSEIFNATYTQYGISSEPSADEIARAVQMGNFETRGFQSHKEELNDEWNAQSSSKAEYCERLREYHARRIAYFVAHENWEPLLLEKDRYHLRDGLHRLKAAVFKGCQTVDVEIAAEP